MSVHLTTNKYADRGEKAMAIVGHIKEICRFPVKSMQGGRIETAEVTATGIVGDRGWAMRDDVRNEVQWGKKYPQLMLCAARYVTEPSPGHIPPVDITFPDGEVVRSGLPRVNEKLSALIGRPASLWSIQPPSNREFYKRYKPDEQTAMADIAEAFAREPGEPMPDMAQFPEELIDLVAFPGTFFDVTPLQMLTTASLRYMATKNPQANWDVRRFRPNFLIETLEGVDGLAENDWIGAKVRIGSAVIELPAPTPRCGMTMRPQADLPFDKSVLRTIVKESDQNLGIYANVITPGTIKTGDVVEILSS